MRVKLLSRSAGPEGSYPPGRVIEVDDETARRMVVARQAVYTLEPVTQDTDRWGGDREKQTA